jgi:hypothetical protein
MRIFISSTFVDLRGERDAAAEALRRMICERNARKCTRFSQGIPPARTNLR